MGNAVIDKERGRVAFGLDPAGYDQGRPDYPDWVFEALQSKCGLGDGTAMFEIGAGTGKATRNLLRSGARPVLAIEPDAHLARFLEKSVSSLALQVINSAFEDAALPSDRFALATSATAFHWLDEPLALQKVAAAIRLGGWWAPFWNIFGNPACEEPFHEATNALLADGPINSSNQGHARLEFGADKDARLAALEAAQLFDNLDVLESTWFIKLNPSETMRLYSSFSNITLRPDRERVIAEIGRIAEEEFGGVVMRNMTTVLYLARRTA